MYKKLLILLPCLLLHLSSFYTAAQEKKGREIDDVTNEELEMAIYQKDTTANAVVLYEEGNNYFEVERKGNFQFIRLIKQYYCKIKILNEKGFDEANIEIPFYHADKETEKISNIKAMTHNGPQKIVVGQNDIYVTDINEHWSAYRFTFSDVKKGSVLEYRYTLKSPFFFNFEGWQFQSHIPKVKSRFTALIPGNYVYNRTLFGSQKLAVNDASLKKSCFYLDGASNGADCEKLTYEMVDVPAFKEEEYMLSEKNYISRIKFELSEFHDFRGSSHKYTKSWEDVDKEFRYDKDIGRQLNKVNFFKDIIPQEALNEENNIKKAEKIYNLIKEYYTWNGKYGLFSDSRITDAYKEKSGNISEINISLINALKAAGLEAKLVLLSTRQNGLPTKLHPIISDFNYCIAMLEINNGMVLLDASDKYAPFGILPFRALNHIGRVMDFKNDSYWIEVSPYKKNHHILTTSVKIDEEGNLNGKFRHTSSGYFMFSKLKEIKTQSKEKYIEELGSRFQNIEITDYNTSEMGNSITETFSFKINEGVTIVNGNIIFSPFLFKDLTENPFKVEDRGYPVDIGYPKKFSSNISVAFPENYKVENTIQPETTLLIENGGKLTLIKQEKGNIINILYNFDLNKSYYPTEEYKELKAIFTKAVNIQNNESLIAKKQV
ncbi:DUF3857 domain-containing protein [Galbibacter pacificus]|uniref:DUF3857 domain-containing protein n=1 Tax=Galbibacter pacificus TaxID=2996052 RepID=UPI002412CBB4|nr:DUF3857 domain-containing protein [Galbibacter pacificus]